MNYKVASVIIVFMILSKISYGHEIGGGYVWQRTNDPVYKFRNGFLLDYCHSFKKVSLGLKWSSTYTNNKDISTGNLIKTKISGVTGYFLMKIIDADNFKVYLGPNYSIFTFWSSERYTDNSRPVIGGAFSLETPDFLFKRMYLKLTIEQKYTRLFEGRGSLYSLGKTTSLTDVQIGLYCRISKSKH